MKPEGEMIDGTYNAKESSFDVVKKFLARRLSMTTKDTRVWSVIGLAAFLLLSEAHRGRVENATD
jgi:hypothetical protein